ncbi:MAG: hypothetical protein CMI02_08410 [Oceanospirillaceae bacterium]|nr:hypothetical protein [Oceanospirillaceae bacterium]MBT12044.1 hypothetical protein [Oceanospirillaceae bacterium]|tara:strand:+ start:71339 stop:71566 length:228 start_codon:yes stop_codon:yes gene_type:complete
MAYFEIESYAVHWDTQENTGTIQLNMINGEVHAIKQLTASTVHMLMDLLRNEKPLYFDTDRQSVHSHFEPIGENE